jgi:hypothetical protein
MSAHPATRTYVQRLFELPGSPQNLGALAPRLGVLGVAGQHSVEVGERFRVAARSQMSFAAADQRQPIRRLHAASGFVRVNRLHKVL